MYYLQSENGYIGFGVPDFFILGFRGFEEDDIFELEIGFIIIVIVIGKFK